MSGYSWVETHPFYMALIAFIICSVFNFIVIKKDTLPYQSMDLNLFFLWLPVIFGLCYAVPSIFYVYEKARRTK